MSNRYSGRRFAIGFVLVIAVGPGCQGTPSAPTELTRPLAAQPAPSIAAVSPDKGAIGGATAVTITGAGFQTGATVTFVPPLTSLDFGEAATTVDIVSSTLITATTPQSVRLRNAVDVVVTNPDRQSGRLTAGYSFVVVPSGVPLSIAAISPPAGISEGGTQIKLTGSGFHYGTTVLLDGVLMRVSVPTAEALYFTTPAHAVGPVDVVVSHPDGQSVTLNGGYTYAAAESLNLDGIWEGRAGGHDESTLRLTVHQSVVISVSCDATSKVTNAAIDQNGRFSVSEGTVVQMTGQFLSGIFAKGTINLPPCAATEWYAMKR